MTTDELKAGESKTLANSRRSIWIGLLVITCLTVLSYSSVFTADFIWDDDAHVLSLEQLASFGGLLKIWFVPGTTIQFYPLVFTVFWGQIHLWGLDPFYFHLVNIVLHAGVSLLFWYCLTLLDIPRAFWAACIFAVHPVHVESVAWITELKNILSAFFYLLAFISYRRYSVSNCSDFGNRRMTGLYYVTSLIFFCFALLSKTVTCTLPAVLLLLAWWENGRIRRKDVLQVAPFFLLSVVLGLLTMKVEADYLLAKGPEWAFTITERLLIAGRATWFHIGKMLWPHPLVFNYPRWHLDASQWGQYFFPISVIVVLLLLWLYKGKIGRGPLAACLFVIGTNFPVLGFLNVYSFRFSFVADHYYYIANFGVITLFCVGFSQLNKKLPSTFVHADKVIFSAIIIICCLLTWQQGKVYQNNQTLFTDIISRNPASWFAYSNRAAYYSNAGEDDLAMADLESSLRIKPDEADALHHRGIISLKRRELDRAFTDFDRSIIIRPWRMDYYKNRAVAYKFAGRLDEALADADHIVSKGPLDVQNLLLRASILELKGDHARAALDLDLVVRLEPENFQGHANRGLVYYRQGRFMQAISEFEEALRLDQGSAESYYNRGLAYVAKGSVGLARGDLLKARELGYKLDDTEISRILSLHVGEKVLNNERR